MSTLQTIKVQNHDQIFSLKKPENFENLKDCFESKFTIPKKDLLIYYIEKADGKRNFVADEDDYQLSFDEPDSKVKFFCDNPAPVTQKCVDLLTVDMLRKTYFQNWESNQYANGLFTKQNFKNVTCYICDISQKEKTYCIECGGADLIDFSAPFTQLTNLVHDKVNTLVLSQFKALHSKIISKYSKGDTSFSLNQLRVSQNSFDGNQSSSQLNTSQTSSPLNNISFFARLTSARTTELPIEAKTSPVTFPETFIEESPALVYSEASILPFPMNFCLYEPKSIETEPTTNKGLTVIEAPPQMIELIYVKLKICKVNYKDGFFTINIAIAVGCSDWPDDVYIVGSKNSPITQNVVVKMGKQLKAKTFSMEVICFELAEDLIKQENVYQMLFSFQRKDKENNISYWSKPFSVIFNTATEKKKSLLSCDFLRF